MNRPVHNVRSPRGAARRGFTLIELMIVVAIMGILATVAIPELMGFIMRTKKAERKAMFSAIIRTVNDYWIANGKLPGGAGTCVLPPNPAQPADASKQPFNTTLGNWGDLSWRPDGHLYFRYDLSATYTAGTGVLYLTGTADLDHDGTPYWMTSTYKLQDGVWQWYSDVESPNDY